MNLFDENENLLPHHGEAKLFSLYSKEEADDYYQKLLVEIKWKQEPIKIFGKEVLQPRLTAWYADKGKVYSYSGITMHWNEWTETLLKIKSKVELVTGYSFNSALLNYYRNGNDSMGWHRDNEKELGILPIIASISFGAARMFKFRNYYEKKQSLAFPLESGSLLLMTGETQHHWEHALAKTKGVISGRINITFRRIHV